MLKKILITGAAILAVFLVVVALQPSDFRIVRSATITAPPPVIFAQVNDLHKWGTWSPWEKIDPNMTRKHEGAPAGTGASYSWDGNSEVGSGRMTIVESRPSDRIRLRLEFFKPMAGVSDTEFTFKPEGNRTTVTWDMTGTNNFVAKAVCMFMNMDKMIGGQFEQGLADLKALSEGAARKIN